MGDVIQIFGDVDMHTTARRLDSVSHHFHAAFTNGEWRVRTNMALNQIGLIALGFGRVNLLGEGDVLIDAGTQFSLTTVALSCLIAGHATQTGLEKTLAQGVERTGDVVRRGMVINHRGTTALDRIQGTDQTAVVQRLLVKHAVETPPKVLERRDEIRARIDIGHDAARQA